MTAFGNRGVCQVNGDGTEHAAHVGADAQFGPLVAGVVAEYGRAPGVNDSVSAFSTTPAFYTLTRSLRDHASARGRLRFASGNTLFYSTGGVAYGKLRSAQTTSNTVNSFTLSRTKDNNYGYAFGGGIEQKTGRNFSVVLQYLYTNLEDDDFRLQVGALASTPTINPFVRINRNGTSFQRTGERFGRHNLGVTAHFRF